jgi:hypothetical protein
MMQLPITILSIQRAQEAAAHNPAPQSFLSPWALLSAKHLPEPIATLCSSRLLMSGIVLVSG